MDVPAIFFFLKNFLQLEICKFLCRPSPPCCISAGDMEAELRKNEEEIAELNRSWEEKLKEQQKEYQVSDA